MAAFAAVRSTLAVEALAPAKRRQVERRNSAAAAATDSEAPN